MKCKMCGLEKPLVDAHIIPRSFYEPLQENGQTPRIVTDIAGEYPKRSPTGVYDKEIVCQKCEQLFSPWDDYGNSFLNQEMKDGHYIISEGERVAYNFGGCDYQKLKLFFLSVLWRASVSNQKIFHNVRLGPFEGKLRSMLQSKDPGDNREFAVALSKFDVPANQTGILDPDKTRYNGVIHYRLYMAGYMAILKVSRQVGSTFGKLYISPNSDVLCIIRNFEQSKELHALQHVVKNAKRPKEG
ncbi:hypothetical protein [Marinimicrobium sp. LS-A18]|uniref:hypothetical protein n=1 Tax=Marinimicrobium sp. LS-A18 TaxID=1381596 RepID=UPI000465722E|nr:hypothetical protein [Marinimicrobium sp. LS-A18]